MNVKFSFFFFCFIIKDINCLDKKKDCQCKILPDSKIVGGKIANHLAYPWIVSLSRIKDETPESLRQFIENKKKIKFHSCGGSIINEFWVLTAAHCVPLKRDNLSFVGYGNDNDLVKIFDFGRIQSIKVIQNSRFETHRYNGRLYNDIALIKLREPLKFTQDIKPACFLNEKKKIYTGYLDHAGWGSTEVFKKNIETREFSKTKASKNLKEIFLFDQSDSIEDCKTNEKIICAKGIEDGESSCKGDSGGPIHYTKNGKSYVVGLTSYSIEEKWKKPIIEICVGSTAYTKISSYLDWIKKYVGDEICVF